MITARNILLVIALVITILVIWRLKCMNDASGGASGFDTFTYFDGTQEESCALSPRECREEITLIDRLLGRELRPDISGDYKPQVLYYGPDVIDGTNETSLYQREHMLGNATSFVRAPNWNTPTSLVIDSIEEIPLPNHMGNWGTNGSTTTVNVTYTPPIPTTGISAFTPARDADPEFWRGREKQGAVSAHTGRPNAEQFASRGESFLTQPDEAFDTVRSASTNLCARSISKCQPSCNIPAEGYTYDLLYNEIMGLGADIHNGPSPDDCETNGLTNYWYKEPC